MIEWIQIGLVATGVLVVLGVIEVIRYFSSVSAPVTRKMAHVVAGVTASIFPFIFDELFSVVVLAAAFLILMLLTRFSSLLGSVHQADPDSAGAFLFPVVIPLIFWFAGGDWLLFMVPMLLLTIPDAVAALAGIRYGEFKFSVNRQTRSLEGSVMFFLTAFIVILIPVLLSERIDNDTAIMLALVLAMLVTGLEAVSVYGIDNLVIPLAGFLGMFMMMDHSTEILVRHAVVIAGIFLILLSVNYWKQLTVSGIIGLTLMLFVIYAWGDWYWMVPALWYCLTFNLGVSLRRFSRRYFAYLSKEQSRGVFEISAVFHLSAVPLVVLFFNLIDPQPHYFSYFILLIGGATAISYFHFTAHWLKRISSPSIPPQSLQSWLIRFAAALTGAAIIYGLAWLADRQMLMHAISTQLLIAFLVIVVLAILQKYVLATYHCGKCGKRVMSAVHCGRDTTLIHGYSFLGLWQGILISMGVSALVTFYLISLNNF